MTLRRSEWRVRADDPKTPLGWWRRKLKTNGLILPLLMVVAIGLTPLDLFELSWVVTGLVALGCLIAMLRPAPSTDVLGPLLPDPAPVGQVRVRVEYRRKGLTTGTDEMALVIVDGWLVGEGVRSRFALRARDVDRFQRWAGGADSLLLKDGSEIRLWGLHDGARTALGQWDRQMGRTEGVSEFPPLGAHPQETARWIGWAWIGIVLALVGLIVVPLLVPNGPDRLLLFLVGVGGGATLLKVAAERLDRLRRLTRKEQEALAEGRAIHQKAVVEGRE